MGRMIDAQPQRIGDAERDRAAEFLREHRAQGRLDQTEFDERLDAALSAKLQSDLDPLFGDLPAPTPGDPGSALTTTGAASQQSQSGQAAPGLSRRSRHYVDIVAWAIWPASIAACLATGWWWMIVIPIIVAGMVNRKKHQEALERKRDQQRLAADQQQRIDSGGQDGETT